MKIESLNTPGGREADFDFAWREKGREQFEMAYCFEDSVYDQLVDRTAPQ